MPNRAQRRNAAQNGVELPILAVKLYADGQLMIDKHGNITTEQVREFLMKVLEDLPDD